MFVCDVILTLIFSLIYHDVIAFVVCVVGAGPAVGTALSTEIVKKMNTMNSRVSRTGQGTTVQTFIH